jgi:integrase
VDEAQQMQGFFIDLVSSKFLWFPAAVLTGCLLEAPKRGDCVVAIGRISKRTVEALAPAERDAYLWDDDLAGFGVKVTPAGRKVYIAQYRLGGRGSATRRMTLGVHGTIKPDEARSAASKVLAKVQLGGDPAADKERLRREGTIADLARRYLQEHVAAHNKPGTRAEMERLVAKRIEPEIGRHRVTQLSRARIKEWHHAMHSMPYEANRALACLSKMMSLASTEWELRADNPCKGVRRFPEQKRERFFADEELHRIGEALEAAQKANSAPAGCVDAIRLLALTGCRLGEVLSFRWADVDLRLGAVRLRDAKAGARTVPLGAPAMALLAKLERRGEFVVCGADAAKPLSANTLRHFWHRQRVVAGVPDSRPHDFRHTAGTYAAQSGANAFMVRDLLGHKTLAMTGRYVERAADPMKATADAVAGRVSRALAGAPSARVMALDQVRTEGRKG